MSGMVEVRGIRIGEGIPKVCIPVMGMNCEEILISAGQVLKAKPDLLEWRADWFLKMHTAEELLPVLEKLREAVGELPLLFTIRTAAEGGEAEIDGTVYARINRKVILSGRIDLVDIELLQKENIVSRLLEEARAAGVKTVISNHDFSATPKKEELVKRLLRMRQLGADIPKIAVMPRDTGDLLALLAATREAVERYSIGPVITMSMGQTGVLSRCCGEIFGSAVTFASAGQASAPGQMEAEDLQILLKLFHKYTKMQEE